MSKNTKSRLRSVQDTTSEAINGAKVRILSMSSSFSMAMNGVGRFIFTKTLGPDNKHSETDKDQIQKRNEEIRKKKEIFTNLPESNCIQSELKSSRLDPFRSSRLKPYTEYNNFSK
jgi:hypothetical protein